MATEKKPGGREPRQSVGALGQLVKAESAIQLALSIPAGVLVGWLAGALLDAHFHTTWMVIAGIVVGALAGFVQMFALAMRFMKSGDK